MADGRCAALLLFTAVCGVVGQGCGGGEETDLDLSAVGAPGTEARSPAAELPASPQGRRATSKALPNDSARGASIAGPLVGSDPGGAFRIKTSPFVLRALLDPSRAWLERATGLLIGLETDSDRGAAMAVAANLFEAAIVTGGLTQRDEERGLVGEPLGHIAFAVIAHASNQVTTITRSSLQRFFTGVATDWAEVGAASLATRVISLPPADPIGARGLTIAIPADHLTASAILCDEIDDVVRQVATSPGGIGLVPLRVPFPAGVRVLAIDSITPTPLAVVNGTYPLAVPVQFVTKGMRSDRATRVLTQLRDAASARALLVQ